MRLIRAVSAWLDDRLQVGASIRQVMMHPVPRRTASWWYVFGSAAVVLFLLQIVTGTLLALVYVPSAADAWNSLQALNHDVALGWYLRAMHGWGSMFMVVVVLAHMVQVFLFGAYKFPRELTWLVGVVLLAATLAMAFTGQILRFDQDAYWGLGIGASIASRTPFIGGGLVELLLGGPIIAGQTLSRFFTLHVFVVPGTLLALVGVHLLLVLNLGINEWPMPGRRVRRDTYLKEYTRLTHGDGVPFVPDAAWRDMVFSAGVVLAVMTCAAMFGPFGPTGMPDPTLIETVPRPDPAFLWVFAVLSLLPPSFETPAVLFGPVAAIVALLLVPFLAGVGEKSWRRRPVAVLTVIVLAIVLGSLTWLGATAPWSPVMNAWSGEPVPPLLLKGQPPLVRQGAVVFQAKQCRNCHALEGTGGRRGPGLDDVATQLTGDQLIRQVLQGGGNMPAYGGSLRPAEVRALVAFLQTLAPAGERPALDASAAGLTGAARATPSP
jgi:ubiquinol-cytochrome c reductase cytochrome b subunit